MHNIKTQKKKGAVLKIDLSKAYDRVNWIYMRLLLTHLGFGIPFINWIMSCITMISFAVLINGATTPFFQDKGTASGMPFIPSSFPTSGRRFK
jgi:hypothetical protein